MHGDIVFDVKVLSDSKNLVVSAGKDGCLFISHVFKQTKLVQLKDFEVTSPMSMFTSIDVHLSGTRILSACGDGTLQEWEIPTTFDEKAESILVIDKATLSH